MRRLQSIRNGCLRADIVGYGHGDLDLGFDSGLTADGDAARRWRWRADGQARWQRLGGTVTNRPNTGAAARIERLGIGLAWHVDQKLLRWRERKCRVDLDGEFLGDLGAGKIFDRDAAVECGGGDRLATKTNGVAGEYCTQSRR